MKPIQVESIDQYDWTEILSESQSEGYNMVNRLLTDFRVGRNRFDAPGEVLFAYLFGDNIVAVAGLNQEPDKSILRTGRIRRLYVLPKFRGKGLARGLVERIMLSAESYFEKITVNVGKLDAGELYEHLGFTPVKYPGITHVKELTHNRALHSDTAYRSRES
jgi:GNAT superfamily N-acetyltransferase